MLTPSWSSAQLW